MIALVAAHQPVYVMAMGAEAVAAAKKALPQNNVEIFDLKFGDMWPRDTGPLFGFENGQAIALRFLNNGWGGKYDLPFDDVIGDDLARLTKAPMRKFDFILEGGAIEWDGEGTVLTTRQCLLNQNRNGWTQGQAEEALKNALGAEKILWLEDGMVNDHTDGHIDNIARFIAPGKVVCQKAAGKDDPNADIFEKIAQDLRGMSDAAGRKLDVVQVPGPGRVDNEDDDPVPASHVNFIITNKVVVVPTYATPSADQAVQDIQKLFPDRKVVGVYSRAILTGGGSFHCMTQQVPA